MFPILWHNAYIVLTIFPGIILFLINRIPYIKKKKEMDKYAVCLFLVVMINLFAENPSLLQKILILMICTAVFFVIEYLLENKKNITWNKICYVLIELKKPFYILLSQTSHTNKV